MTLAGRALVVYQLVHVSAACDVPTIQRTSRSPPSFGAKKPSPVIVTVVPPTIDADDGEIASRSIAW